MGTHVFIVNNNTFSTHLQYLFAGTGAYNRNRKIWVDEHIGLLTDIKRLRTGDLVLFYIEATKKVKGGFYGIFRVAKKNPTVFHTPGKSGFQPNLKKKLIYRTFIEPLEVYSEGVPEWEALDKLPVYATEIQWSLIYRKLKGKRGCTPLLPWEAERLMDMIRNKNSGKFIPRSLCKKGLDWDRRNRRIIASESPKIYSYPRGCRSNTLQSITNLQKQGRAYENYLQLYLSENAGISKILSPIVGNGMIWFGNEVASGVGMQKIDFLTICQNKKRKEYRIIELKDESATPDIVDQIEYYVNWASQNSGRHLNGAFNWNMQAVIVSPQSNTATSSSVVSAFKNYNRKKISLPILYFEFKITKNKIQFNQVRY